MVYQKGGKLKGLKGKKLLTISAIVLASFGVSFYLGLGDKIKKAIYETAGSDYVPSQVNQEGDEQASSEDDAKKDSGNADKGDNKNTSTEEADKSKEEKPQVKKYNMDKVRNYRNCIGKFNSLGPTQIIDEKYRDSLLYLCHDRYEDRYDPAKNVTVLASMNYLTRDYIKNKFIIPKRFEKTRYNPTIPENMQITSEDIIAAGYVPGQMAPIQFSFDSSPVNREHLLKTNEHNFTEATYITNYVPETQAANNYRNLINRQFWDAFREKGVVSLYITYGSLYLNGQNKGTFTAKNGLKVVVPTHYFYVAASVNTFGILAYIIPNENNLGPLNSYRVNLTEVERLAGLRFMPNLPNYRAAYFRGDVRELNRGKQ